MPEINCPHRSARDSDQQSVCAIVATLTSLPLTECLVNDSACNYCLGCGVDPATPNKVTASMGAQAVLRVHGMEAHQQFVRRHVVQFAPPPPSPPKPCVYRKGIVRRIPCRTCQSGTGKPEVEVYECALFLECTPNSTSLPVTDRPRSCSICDRQQDGVSD